jgi:hypothetical protein
MTNIELPDAGATMALVTNLQSNLPDFARMVDRHGHAAPALRQLGHITGGTDISTQPLKPFRPLSP